jgi:hypothetical protein
MISSRPPTCLGPLRGQAPATVVTQRLSPEATGPVRLSAVWSRGHPVEAARATSPVRASPLWAAEAAQLAERTGLHDRALAEAGRAAAGLIGLLGHAPFPKRSHGRLLRWRTSSSWTIRLRQGSCATAPGNRLLRHWSSGSLSRRAHPHELARRRIGAPARIRSRSRACSGRLTRASSPKGCFCRGYRLALTLIVRRGCGQDRVIVAASLAPELTPDAPSCCRARPVDPAARRVLASAPSCDGPGPGRAHGPLPRRRTQGPGSKWWTMSSGRSGASSCAGCAGRCAGQTPLPGRAAPAGPRVALHRPGLGSASSHRLGTCCR